MSEADAPIPDHCARLVAASEEYEKADNPVQALETAWQAYRLAPGDAEAGRTLARLLRFYPSLSLPAWREGLAGLLEDANIEPRRVAPAAWHLQLAGDQPLVTLAGDPAALARWAEADGLTHRLLEQCPVTELAAERALTGLRRWLLQSGTWPDHPRLVAAMAAQAAWTGGAWLVDADERARLESETGSPIAAAYFPPSPKPRAETDFADSVTGAVADQYERWPYPIWSRVTRPRPRTLPDTVAEADGGRPSALPVEAEVLVAGCGTGRETARCAFRFPDARITAIDISEASLAYARERCAALGLDRIAFRRLELQRIGDLGQTFDYISCCGVLHHLPDPEAGWGALETALRPGGVMRVMVYSSVARLLVRTAQRHLEDLRNRPVDADLLRDVRRRLIERMPALLGRASDFYTLTGVHDLLLHRHEDPFDVARIGRALDRLGLELLAFKLPSPWHRARYLEENPGDPLFRDMEAWARLEKRDPFLFGGMYDFLCRKPG